MNRKLYRLNQKLYAAKKRIFSSQQEWEKFLSVAVRFTYYPFHQQIQIYDQKPDAMGIMESSRWQKDGMWFRPETQGLSVVDTSDPNHPVVREYRDMSTVYPHTRDAKLPEIFVFPVDQTKEVMDRICGDWRSELEPEERLWNWIGERVENHQVEYMLEQLEKSGLKFLPPEMERLTTAEKEKEIHDFMHITIAYQIFSRMGLDLQKCQEWNARLLEGHSYDFSVLAKSDQPVVDYIGNTMSQICFKSCRAIRQPAMALLEEQKTQPDPKPVGRIEYLGPDNTPEDSVEYTDPEQFIQSIRDDTYYRVPITVVLYQDEQGETIPKGFLNELDPPPKEIRVEDISEPVPEEAVPVSPPGEPLEEEKTQQEHVPDAEKEPKPVGRVDYLSSDGTVGYSTEYADAEQFIKRVKDECYYGVPITVVLYQDEQGETIPQDFLDELDPPPKGFHVEDLPEPVPEEVVPVSPPGEPLEEEKTQQEHVPDAEKEPKPVGRVDYLSSDGTVGYSTEYADAEQFIKRVKDECYYGVPITVVLYQDEQGGTIPQDFLDELDPPPKGFHVEDTPRPVPEEDCPEPDDPAEILDMPASNFRITDYHLGEGGAKEKFRANMDALQVLRVLESENRNAFPEEQEILSRYVGWGGLADAFDEKKTNWAKEFQELRAALSPEEYAAARASTLNAHYTSPAVIREIYYVLRQLGFENGNILEPAMGVGNFFGMLPDAMRNSNLYGVELDSISGRIAQKLYPNANISISGYEKTKFPNNFFDVVVGNVPFGDYKVADRAYDKHNFMIHDYFIAKGLDQLRPGGIMAVITSSGTMDKGNPHARKYFAERAQLLGAIRLPDHVFKANAGAEVMTDILFFQKYDGRSPEPNPSWVYSTKNISDKELPMAGDIVSRTSQIYDVMERRMKSVKKEYTVLSVEMNERTQKPIYEIQDHTEHGSRYKVTEVDLERRGEPIYTCNQYFHEHPDMVLGKLTVESGPFGDRLTCKHVEDGMLFTEKFQEAAKNIQGHITESHSRESDANVPETIPADPSMKNFSFSVIDGDLYFRKDSLCYRQQLPDDQDARVRALVDLKDAGYRLLNMELEDRPMDEIRSQMQLLNQKYDSFAASFGRIQAKENQVFRQDASSGFVRAFEVYNEDGVFLGKADIFEKRTVRPHVEVTTVETANDALMVSLQERGCIDLPYMASLLGGNQSPETVADKLKGMIFRNPELVTEDPYSGYETADAYLSGNIRTKLLRAETAAMENPDYQMNVTCLKEVMPEPLDASEIDVRLGATWIKPEYIEQFMQENFQLPKWRFSDMMAKRDQIQVSFDPESVEWNISNKRIGRDTPLAVSKYGTERKNGLEILENALNLRDTKVYDRVIDEDGKEQSVLNKKETALCNTKAELLKSDFESWIFRDPDRRVALVQTYNERFNTMRPRSFDGSFLKFPGMNPDIMLREHQKNAVARTLFGNNTLLAHVVGAGKTYTMASSAMEAKRIGIASKSLFVVPNHLTEQWGKEFLELYPAANILVARKEDFIPDNRRTFCSRIATGDYDAVIIGHSQFEKIPLSAERQKRYIEDQIRAVTEAISDSKQKDDAPFTVKQLQKTEKKLRARMEKLEGMLQRDDVVTFEQLGVDRLYVDESHYYKNLFLYTKMANVAGIQQTEAAKSSDMLLKCRYMDEVTGGKGITFATGTPLSNSMTELYTNMRYLQAGLLKSYGLEQFDAWAANFGNVVTAIELSPEGSGYRSKKRFSSFFNIPELMSLWHEAADVQTADMLKLPVPKAHIYNVQTQPSELQKSMVAALSDRAEKVRSQSVDPSEDNMLKITNDGRKLALDQRLIHPDMPDLPNSKVNACVDKTFQIWERTREQCSTQMIFCDLSTPKGDGAFNVYDDIRNKLTKRGIPEKEIAFIHEANTDQQKDRLFRKVRSGEVRVLLGSTFKMGAGTNVQDHLIALHHLDVPWRPSDIEQREGRIIRQGNQNPEVEIYRYVTADTFDAYSWQLIENKQKFISQVMTSKSPVRKCADIDDSALSYAEVKALATGNPYIKEKMELDVSVARLKMERAAFESERYRLQDACRIYLPGKLASLEERIEGMKTDIAAYQSRKPADAEQFTITLKDEIYTDRNKAAERFLALAEKHGKEYHVPVEIGNYLGFPLTVTKEHNFIADEYTISVQGELAHKFQMSMNGSANFANMTRILNSMPERLEKLETELEDTRLALKAAQEEAERPFEKEAVYQEQLTRLKELEGLLSISENADSELAVSADSGERRSELEEYVKIEPEDAWEQFKEYHADEFLHRETERLPEPKVMEFTNSEDTTVPDSAERSEMIPETSVMEFTNAEDTSDFAEQPDGQAGETDGYRLEFSTLGNGITVWNRNAPIFEAPEDTRHRVSDYETIAYISPDGKNVTYFQEKSLVPEEVQKRIQDRAHLQETLYRPENLKVDARMITADLSKQESDALLQLPGIERVRFELETYHWRASKGIDSGDIYRMNGASYERALDLFLNLSDEKLEKIYAVIEPDGSHSEPEVYQINREQAEFYARQELIKNYGHGNTLTDPLVVIAWSESHGFTDGEIMSLREAETRFAGYDQAQSKLVEAEKRIGDEEYLFGVYEKTKFYIVSDVDGQLTKYEGRYDIGDNENGLLSHIYSVQKYLETDENNYASDMRFYGKEYADEIVQAAREFLESELPRLQSYCRFEIKEDLETGQPLYQIYDHFLRDHGEFGGFVKENGETLYFKTADSAKRYLEEELGLQEYQPVHHSVQKHAIRQAEQGFADEKLEAALNRLPNKENHILDIVSEAGYAKKEGDELQAGVIRINTETPDILLQIPGMEQAHFEVETFKENRDSGDVLLAGRRSYDSALELFLNTSGVYENKTENFYAVVKSEHETSTVYQISQEQVEFCARQEILKEYGHEHVLLEPVVVVDMPERDGYYGEPIPFPRMLPLREAEIKFAAYDHAQYELTAARDRMNDKSTVFGFGLYDKIKFHIISDREGQLIRHDGHYALGNDWGGILQQMYSNQKLQADDKSFYEVDVNFYGKEYADKKAQTIKEFLESDLLKLQTYCRFEIKDHSETGKPLYQIYDHFASQNKEFTKLLKMGYGEYVKDPTTGENLSFSSADSAKRYLENELRFRVYQPQYHAVQKVSIHQEEQKFMKERIETVQKRFPSEKEKILEAARNAGYAKQEESIVKHENVRTVKDTFSCSVKENVLKSNTSFEKAVLKLVVDCNLHHLKGKVRHTEFDVDFVRTNKDGKLVMPVEEIDRVMHLENWPDFRKNLADVAQKAKIIEIQDPYNRLDLPFDQYMKHEQKNPWKNPEAAYSVRGIKLTAFQKEKLQKLNRECGCCLSARDIKKIANGEAVRKGGIKKGVQEGAKELLDVANQYETKGGTGSASAEKTLECSTELE